MPIVTFRFTDTGDNPIDIRFYKDPSNACSLLTYKDPDDPSNKTQLYKNLPSVSTAIISNVPARLLASYVYNKSTSIRYLQLYNRTTALSTGSVPTMSRVLAPGEKYDLGGDEFGGSEGLLFSLGLVWGFSTTEDTYTAGLAADVSCEIFWRLNSN
jgi:hypothetical protein